MDTEATKIFNIKILFDNQQAGWKHDYSQITDILGRFPHIKIEQGRWTGLMLCSTDIDKGLKARIIN